MADNGYDYPSETELRNIFASSCVEAAARKLQIPAVELYRRMKRVHLFRDLILIGPPILTYPKTERLTVSIPKAAT